MPKFIDLTNQKFEKLTVIRKAPSKKGHVYWYCSCDCGQSDSFLAQGCHLKDGTVTHCDKCDKKHIVKEDEVNYLSTKRKCVICGKEFFPNFDNRKYCYDCSPISSKEDRAITITHLRRAIKKQLVKYKGGQCSICGYDKSLNALQFHHLDSSNKDFTLAAAYNNGHFDMNKLYQEVDKCILVCANCHAELHEKESIFED